MKKYFFSLLFLCNSIFAAPVDVFPYHFTGDYTDTALTCTSAMAPVGGCSAVLYQTQTSLTTYPAQQSLISAMPKNLPGITLAFGIGVCGSETWQWGRTAAQFASGNIPQLIAAGKSYAISFGGAGNTFKCASNANFLTTIANYVGSDPTKLKKINADIEGGATGGNFVGAIAGTTLTYTSGTVPSIGSVIMGACVAPGTEVMSGSSPTFAVNKSSTCSSGTLFSSLGTSYTQTDVNNLVSAMANAQATYPNLWFTFTVGAYGGSAPQLSLGTYGIYVYNALQATPITNYSFVLMAIDASNDTSHCIQKPDLLGCDMGASAVSATTNVNSWYGIPFNHIGLSLMIGTNDTTVDVLTIQNITTIAQFANSKNLTDLTYWDFSRDIDCAISHSVSAVCNSYGNAGTLGFTKKLLTETGY